MSNEFLFSSKFWELLNYSFELYPGSFIADSHVDVRLTYERFQRVSKRLSKEMENKYLNSKDIVHFIGKNSLALCACYCAVVYNDWVPVGSGSRISLSKLERNVNSTHAKGLVISKKLWKKWGNMLESKTLNMIFVYDEIQKDEFFDVEIRVILYDDIDVRLVYDKSKLKNTSFICMTSGSTGLPKPVMIDHHLLLKTMMSVTSSFLGLLPIFQKMFILSPPFSNSGGMLTFFIGIFCGHNIVIMESFSPKLYLDTFTKYNCNYILCTSAMLIALANYSNLSDYNLNHTASIVCGGDMINIEAMNVIKEKTKISDIVEFFQVYGSSECPITHFTKSDINSIEEYLDPPASAIECKIMNVSTNMECAIGENGELWIKSPSTMLGYFGDEEKTNSVLTEDGWYKTGDIAHFDQVGKLYICGRLEEIVKFNEHTIYSEELEKVILQHPTVKIAAVFGEHHEHGEIPIAVVERLSDVTEDELLEFVNEQVSEFKRLHQIYFVSNIRLNNGNKVDKISLKRKVRSKPLFNVLRNLHFC